METTLLLVLAVMFLGAAAYRWLPERVAPLLVSLGRSAAGLRARTADIPGFRIAYLEGGKGEPLVLLHGIGGDKDNWTLVASLLTRHYRVLAPDIPGFGESSRPSGEGYGVGDQVDRIRAFLRAVGVEHAHVGGNSMGGLIACHYAHRYPSEVASLWLLATAYVASAKPSEGFERLERGEKNPLFARVPAELDDVLDFVMEKRPFLPSPLKQALAAQQAAHYELNLAIFEELRRSIVPLEQVMAGHSVPTLIVWGDHDRVFDFSSAEILRRVMPRARAIVLRGIGHVPMVEAPLRTARDYLAFRRGLAEGTPPLSS